MSPLKFVTGQRVRLLPIVVILSLILGLGAFAVAVSVGTSRTKSNCEEIEEVKDQLRTIIRRGIRSTQRIQLPGFTEAQRAESIADQRLALQDLKPKPCPRGSIK